MDVMMLEKSMTTITIILCLSGVSLVLFMAWVAKRGAEGRSKYKFEIWLNSPRPKSDALDALVNAIDKLLARKPKERTK